MRWATRPGCHVDRAACAWLIRRFVDPGASFVFVEELEDVPADAIAFDMRGAELSHHDGDCSFETFLHTYELREPALQRIAEAVHEADVGDDRYDAPAAPGLDAVIGGLALVSAGDDELLARSALLFDGLYELWGR